MRTIHHLSIILFFLLSVFPTFAQQATPSPLPPTPLELNESIVGQVQFIYQPVTYSLEVPVDQDVIIAYEADRVVMGSYCTTVTTITDDTASQAEDCVQPGGGGGDYPVSRLAFLPSTEQPDTEQAVEFTLARPYEGPAHYQLQAYPVTPQALALDESLGVSGEDLPRFQAYTLEVDPTQPFTVTISDEDSDGNFLWVAYNPYDFSLASLPISDERELLPMYIDSALLDEEDVESITQMQLYYLGGQTFRVIVESTGAYTLQTTSLNVPTLVENQSISATLSYIQPLQIARIEAAPNTAIVLNAAITDGTGALVSVNTPAIAANDSTVLGITATGSNFPLEGTVEHVIGIDGIAYIFVQIPYEFTRDPVTVAVSWQQN